MSIGAPEGWTRNQARFPGRPIVSCLIIACCIGAPFAVAAQSQDAITFRLGATAFVLERSLVRGQPSPRRFSSKDWMHVTQYVLDFGQSIDFDLREANTTFPCEQYFKTAFVRYQRHVDFPNPDLVADWRLEHTSNPAITRLIRIPPGGIGFQGEEKIERYRFEVPELNDYNGERQQFVYYTGESSDLAPFIRIGIRLTPEISADVRLSSKECFFENGVSVTKYIRNFVIQRMRPAR